MENEANNTYFYPKWVHTTGNLCMVALCIILIGCLYYARSIYSEKIDIQKKELVCCYQTIDSLKRTNDSLQNIISTHIVQKEVRNQQLLKNFFDFLYRDYRNTKRIEVHHYNHNY